MKSSNFVFGTPLLVDWLCLTLIHIISMLFLSLTENIPPGETLLVRSEERWLFHRLEHIVAKVEGDTKYIKYMKYVYTVNMLGFAFPILVCLTNLAMIYFPLSTVLQNSGTMSKYCN